MKWYLLAHLAAVTMSCFLADLQALQLLFPNSASGIARALPSFLLYIFKFPVSRCRPLASLSNNLNPFQRCLGRKHKLCTYGAGMVKSRQAGTPSYAKTTDFSGSIFPRSCQKKNRYSIHYSSNCRGKHLLDDIAMVIVQFRPRWTHTYLYALHSLLRPTMTSGRQG